MNNGDVRNIGFKISTASEPFAAIDYLGTIRRYSSSYAVVSVQATTGVGAFITGRRGSSGTWSWESLSSNIAENSNLHYQNDTTNHISCSWIHFGRICLLGINMTYSGTLSYNVYSNMGVPKPQTNTIIPLRDATAGNLNGRIYIDGSGNLSDWANGTGNLTSGHSYEGMVAFIAQATA